MSDAALRFFNENYRVVVAHQLLHGSPRGFVETTTPKKCRYCGRDSGSAATFRTKAHAVPELIGNKWLFAHDECDDCNQHFSSHLEDHLAKYLGLGRTLSQIKGKRGVPQTGRSNRSHIKVESQIEIRQFAGDELAEIDFEKKEIRVTARREPYIPAAVFKAFAKMAYAILPEEMQPEYSHLRTWLRSDRYDGAGFSPLKVLQLFMPGPMPIPGVRLLLLQRRGKDAPLPTAIFVVAFANYCFQVPLPALPGDAEITDYDMYFFPANTGADQQLGPPGRATLDLTSESLVTGHEQRQILTFESYTEAERGEQD